MAQGWSTSWLIFAGYALVVAVLFCLIFRNPKKKVTGTDVREAEAAAAGDPEI